MYQFAITGFPRCNQKGPKKLVINRFTSNEINYIGNFQDTQKFNHKHPGLLDKETHLTCIHHEKSSKSISFNEKSKALLLWPSIVTQKHISLIVVVARLCSTSKQKCFWLLEIEHSHSPLTTIQLYSKQIQTKITVAQLLLFERYNGNKSFPAQKTKQILTNLSSTLILQVSYLHLSDVQIIFC